MGFVIFAMLKRVDELPSPVITAYTESSISNGVTVRGLWIVIVPDGEGSKISINPDGGPFCVLDCAVASCIAYDQMVRETVMEIVMPVQIQPPRTCRAETMFI